MFIHMKTRENGLPITIEGYPIHINKNEKDFQVFLTHRNGDQTINGWFTYDDAVKEIKKQKINIKELIYKLPIFRYC